LYSVSGKERTILENGMRSSLLVAVAISVTACVSAEPPTPPQPTTSHAVSAADYPSESIKAEEGATTLRYIILENGTVGDVQILKSSGFSRLDQASAAMVKSKWRFEPVTQNGRPVKVSIPAQVAFALSPTRASYMLVEPEHAASASETETKPGEQALIAQIHRIYMMRLNSGRPSYLRLKMMRSVSCAWGKSIKPHAIGFR
jgi:TonB family protein